MSSQVGVSDRTSHLLNMTTTLLLGSASPIAWYLRDIGERKLPTFVGVTGKFYTLFDPSCPWSYKPLPCTPPGWRIYLPM